MIIKVEKQKNYTVISNHIFKDDSISARAKGIYAYLMTLPEDWKLYKSELFKHFTEGEKAINTAFKELEENNYIFKSKSKGEKGKFTGWEYTIYEVPPETAISARSENGKSENRPVGNGGLLSTNELNTNKLNTNEQTVSTSETLKKPFTGNQLNAIKGKNAPDKFRDILEKNLEEISDVENGIRTQLYLFTFTVDTPKAEMEIKYNDKYYIHQYQQSIKIAKKLSLEEIKEIFDYINHNEYWSDNYCSLYQLKTIESQIKQAS